MSPIEKETKVEARHVKVKPRQRSESPVEVKAKARGASPTYADKLKTQVGLDWTGYYFNGSPCESLWCLFDVDVKLQTQLSIHFIFEIFNMIQFVTKKLIKHFF